MLRLAANVSTMFTEWPLVDRFAAAADAGFAAVEMQFPYEVTCDALAKARQAATVEVVLINLPAGDLAAGDLGLACRPDRRADFAESLARATEYAQALDCKQVNCLAGLLTADLAPDCAWATLTGQIDYAASVLQGHGIALLVEALNEINQPHFVLNTLTLADRLLGELDHPNLALQFDIYHAVANGEDWHTALLSRLPRIGHIQFSDFPGRGEPGSGTIDFDKVFACLRNLDYAGWIGCEYRPTGHTLKTLDWRGRV
jgi:hydroxypyruvate isomerase